MITYNHEKFIAQALESALMQKVSFEYEIVVGEDCSTDNTRQILIDYQSKYPEKIRLLLPEKNLGAINNFVATFQECRGDYIAIIEGDDYWTYPGKLQKQVEFLEDHPESSACFHNVNICDEDGVTKDRPFLPSTLKSFFTLEDIVLDFFIPTCSVVFRNKLFKTFPNWYYSMPVGDWPLHILNAEHGNFGYIDEVFACYRVHENSMWSTRNSLDVKLKTIFAKNVINRHLKFKFKKKIQTDLAKSYYVVTQILIKDRNWKGACFYAFKCIFALLSGDFISSAKLPFIFIMRAFSKFSLFLKRALSGIFKKTF